MTIVSTLRMCPLLLAGAAEPETAESCFRRLAAGELAAAAELYDRFGSEVYGLALWTCGSAADAADVVQEVFLRLIQRRSRLAAVRRARPYLLSVARRAAIDLVRKRRRHEPLAEELLAPATSDPAARIEAARLGGRLARLPPQQRTALYLRYFSELSYAEIGRVTGVPTFTAASRCRLALRRLRRGLEKGPRR